jgi:hypothetical protein
LTLWLFDFVWTSVLLRWNDISISIRSVRCMVLTCPLTPGLTARRSQAERASGLISTSLPCSLRPPTKRAPPHRQQGGTHGEDEGGVRAQPSNNRRIACLRWTTAWGCRRRWRWRGRPAGEEAMRNGRRGRRQKHSTHTRARKDGGPSAARTSARGRSLTGAARQASTAAATPPPRRVCRPSRARVPYAPWHSQPRAPRSAAAVA